MFLAFPFPPHSDVNMVVVIVNVASVYGDEANWREAMESGMRKLGESHTRTLTAMDNQALIYLSEGFLGAAEQLLTKVVRERERTLGAQHEDTLAAVAHLESTYERFRRVVETRGKVLGKKHPSTLTAMSELASRYFSRGLFKEAEELYVDVVQARRTVLGVEHKDTLAAMDSLASTYFVQERFEEGGALSLQVAEIRRRIYGVSPQPGT